MSDGSGKNGLASGKLGDPELLDLDFRKSQRIISTDLSLKELQETDNHGVAKGGPTSAGQASAGASTRLCKRTAASHSQFRMPVVHV